MQPRKDLVQVS